MALPRDITRSSLTAVKADRDTSGLGAVALLMPRYSLSYDIGLGAVGTDAFAPVKRRMRHTGVAGNLGDDASDQAQLTTLQASLHDLATAIGAAQAAGQTDAIPGLRDQFNQTKALVDQLVAKLHGEEAPSGFAMTVANIGDTLRGFGGNLAIAAGIGLVLLVAVPALIKRAGR